MTPDRDKGRGYDEYHQNKLDDLGGYSLIGDAEGFRAIDLVDQRPEHMPKAAGCHQYFLVAVIAMDSETADIGNRERRRQPRRVDGERAGKRFAAVEQGQQIFDGRAGAPDQQCFGALPNHARLP
jgi:hypothetical protein